MELMDKTAARPKPPSHSRHFTASQTMSMASRLERVRQIISMKMVSRSPKPPKEYRAVEFLGNTEEYGTIVNLDLPEPHKALVLMPWGFEPFKTDEEKEREEGLTKEGKAAVKEKVFKGWSIDNVIIDTNSSLMFVVSHNCDIKAIFDSELCKLTVSSNSQIDALHLFFLWQSQRHTIDHHLSR